MIFLLCTHNLQPELGYGPHTVTTVYIGATIKGLIYPYEENYPTATELGAVSKACPTLTYQNLLFVGSLNFILGFIVKTYKQIGSGSLR